MIVPTTSVFPCPPSGCNLMSDSSGLPSAESSFGSSFSSFDCSLWKSSGRLTRLSFKCSVLLESLSSDTLTTVEKDRFSRRYGCGRTAPGSCVDHVFRCFTLATCRSDQLGSGSGLFEPSPPSAFKLWWDKESALKRGVWRRWIAEAHTARSTDSANFWILLFLFLLKIQTLRWLEPAWRVLHASALHLQQANTEKYS